MESFVGLRKLRNHNTSNLILCLLLSIIVLLFTSSILRTVHSSNSNVIFLVQLAPFTFALLLILLFQKYIFKSSIIQLFNNEKKIRWKNFFFSFGIWSLILFSIFLIQWFDNPRQFTFQFDFFSFLNLTIVCLFFVSLQTLFEEVFFRSLLLHLMSFIFPNRLVIAISISVLFMLLHYGNPEVNVLGKSILLYYFFTSLFLTLIVTIDNGIEISFGFHAANNLFGSLFLTNNWQVFQTKALFVDNSPPAIGWDIWIILVILYPLLLFFLFKIKNIKFGSIFVNDCYDE